MFLFSGDQKLMMTPVVRLKRLQHGQNLKVPPIILQRHADTWVTAQSKWKLITNQPTNQPFNWIIWELYFGVFYFAVQAQNGQKYVKKIQKFSSAGS